MSVPCRVGVDGLVVRCIIGINPWERATPQDLVINLCVEMDASRCINSEAMGDGLDYRHLSDVVVTTASEGKFQLIETLAWHILNNLLGHFYISWASIKISKPKALDGNGIAFVEMERRGPL